MYSHDSTTNPTSIITHPTTTLLLLLSTTTTVLLDFNPQITPLRMNLTAVSLGSVGEGFDWADPAGFSPCPHLRPLVSGAFKQGMNLTGGGSKPGGVGENKGCDNPAPPTLEYSLLSPHSIFDAAHCVRETTEGGETGQIGRESMRVVVQDLWEAIGGRGGRVGCDQITRSTLFRVWLVCFPGDSSPLSFQPTRTPPGRGEEGCSVKGHFSYLHPTHTHTDSGSDASDRLTVPNPLHCTNEVNKVRRGR